MKKGDLICTVQGHSKFWTVTVVHLFRKSIYPRLQDVGKRSEGESEGQSTSTSMKKVFTSSDKDMAVRLRVLKCYVWSTLLYGCETWTTLGAM